MIKRIFIILFILFISFYISVFIGALLDTDFFPSYFITLIIIFLIYKFYINQRKKSKTISNDKDVNIVNNRNIKSKNDIINKDDLYSTHDTLSSNLNTASSPIKSKVSTTKSYEQNISVSEDTKSSLICKNYDRKKYITKLKDYNPDNIDFIAIDTETTGFNTYNDEIIEIAAIKYSNLEEVEYFSTLINPKLLIPDRITKITGIDNEMVMDKPTMNEVMPYFLDFINTYDIVGHNISFDIRFINKYINEYKNDIDANINNKCIDTVSIARKLYPDLQNHKLSTLVSHLEIPIKDAHRAYDDAKASSQIYINKIKNDLQEEIDFLDNLTEHENIIKDYTFKVFEDIPINKNKIKVNKTSQYFDFYFDVESLYMQRLLRYKLNGNIQYLLYDIKIEDFKLKYPNILNISRSSKSEGDKTRINIDFNNIDFLYDPIIHSYNESIKTMNKNIKYLKNCK